MLLTCVALARCIGDDVAMFLDVESEGDYILEVELGVSDAAQRQAVLHAQVCVDTCMHVSHAAVNLAPTCIII